VAYGRRGHFRAALRALGGQRGPLRANLTVVLADGDPGRLTQLIWPDGQSPSIRRMLVDMIEEYARHTGHADLLRESIDGVIGEDPPP